MSIPETRPSLLLRIRDSGDRQAWTEFCDLYRPVIVALARQRGLQPADAEDLAQQVLVAISNAIDRFDPQQGPARFRTWLKTIARNAIINTLTRRPPDVASGGQRDLEGLLHAQPHASGDTDELIGEYRRQIFLTAASQIRSECEPSTWEAFWRSSIDCESVDAIAAAMKRSVGSVYTARSRVMKRLKEKVRELDLSRENEE